MKRSLFYIVLALALTYLVREFLYAGIRRNTGGEFAKLREVFLDSTKYDLLIIGSSRAESQYQPQIIDSICRVKSYNAGMLGATMPFVEATYEAWKHVHGSPKTLVVNIDYHAFSDNPDTIHQYPRYFPYFGNKVMYEKFSARDHRLIYAKWIAPYSMGLSGERYLNAAIRGWAGIAGKYDATTYHGYSPVPFLSVHPPDPDTMHYTPYQSKMPKAVRESLERIIAMGQKDDTEIILVLSPLYYRLSESLQNEQELKHYYQQLAQSHPHIRLLDLSSDSMRYEKKYFADPAHLNTAGAKHFSEIFSEKLKD